MDPDCAGESAWDSPRAVAACVCAAIAAYGVYLALPLILGALSDRYGFTERDIGWTGAAENLGLLLGSVWVSTRARTGRFRSQILAGILIAMLGNVLTAGIQTFMPMASARLLTGFGSGVCYSAGVACLSLMRNSSRHFSLLIVVLVIINSLELWLVPSLLGLTGLGGLYFVFAGLFLFPAVLLGALPAQLSTGTAISSTQSLKTPQAFRSMAWWCLFAIVMFNVAASAFWAYSERIGLSVGMSARSVSDTLTLCNLFSLTGGVLAYWLGRRWGQHRPQLVIILIMLLVFGSWSFRISSAGYVAGVLLFFEVWSMTQVYQLGPLSGIDATGGFVALVPAAQGLGQSAGPFIAGALLGWGMGYPGVLMVMSVFVIACFAGYLLVYLRLRHAQPELAAA